MLFVVMYISSPPLKNIAQAWCITGYCQQGKYSRAFQTVFYIPFLIPCGNQLYRITICLKSQSWVGKLFKLSHYIPHDVNCSLNKILTKSDYTYHPSMKICFQSIWQAGSSPVSSQLGSTIHLSVLLLQPKPACMYTYYLVTSPEKHAFKNV